VKQITDNRKVPQKPRHAAAVANPTGKNYHARNGSHAPNERRRDVTDPRGEIRSQLIAGKVVEVDAGVRRVVAPNAGMMTGPGTNTYLLGERQVAVVDPGPSDPGHLQAIMKAAGDNIRWIVVTHTHRDHSPLAMELAQRTGAELIGLPPPNDGRQDESFRPQRLPGDGERLQLGALALTAIHTPGHASNCVCYLLEDLRLLFTGDHVLEGVSPVILPPDGDMSAYFGSLEKLVPYSFERIAPGHGALLGRGKTAVSMLHAHRVARENKVLAKLGGRPATIDQLTPDVYDDVPAERHSWAKLTLEAHLIKLGRDGRVTESGGTWRLSAT
jgi:glyoxylase-like metal-dependent hydrolase (beta-lactamase superfamily II)